MTLAPAGWTSHPTVARLSDVVPEQMRWLWEGRIPRAKLSVLDGDPGVGKSTLALDVAARVSSGRPMPDEASPVPPGVVVLLSAEDGLADTIVPRLTAAGADLTRIVAITEVTEPDGAVRPPSLPQDIDLLEKVIADADAVLVIIDVLFAYLDPIVNTNRDADVRRVLSRVARMAERTGAAVLVIRHLNKQSSAAALYRGGGSIGILGAARSALVVAIDPDDPGRQVLASMKSNLAVKSPSLAYRLVPYGPVAQVNWEGQSRHSAESLLAARRPERSGRRDADAVGELLASGTRRYDDVRRQAAAMGISEARLRRAGARLGVESRKVGFGRDSFQTWNLSGQTDVVGMVSTSSEMHSMASMEVGHSGERHGETIDAVAPYRTACGYASHRAAWYPRSDGSLNCGTCHPLSLATAPGPVAVQ